MTSVTIPILLWWLAIIWTYTEIFPRPYDDWKNTLLYAGAGILVILFTLKRKTAGPVAELLPSPRNSGDPSEGVSAPPTVFLFGVTGYFLLCAASIAAAPTGRYEGVLELARLILWAGLAWVFAQCSMSTWLWLMRMNVISAAAIAGLTWLQSRGMQVWPYGSPFLAPIGHISYYGDFMALSLVMAIALLVWQTKTCLVNGFNIKWLRVLGWGGCVFLIDAGLALSATRASIIGVFAAIVLAIPLVVYATRSFKKSAVFVVIAFLNVVIILGLPVHSQHGGTATQRLSEAANLSHIEAASPGRWRAYITSSQMIKERPVVGWGLGSFRFVYPEFAQRTVHDDQVSSALWFYHPHNEVLHQAVELGLTGIFLFFVGLAYLLYRGTKALGPRLIASHSERCGEDDESNGVLLITALSGLVVAFVSWQFSTTFLFPVIRLMTAFFAGIVLNGVLKVSDTFGAPSPKGCRTLSVIVILSTLLLAAYQLSLVCVQRQQRATTLDSARSAAAWAVRLAPGAFDPLYVRASMALRTESLEKAAPAVEALYVNYPYTPAVLHMMGYLRARQGNFPEARGLLQHALANDPGNTNAKQLLDQLPPAN